MQTPVHPEPVEGLHLICHPDTPTDAVSSLKACAKHISASRIEIAFILRGDMQRIKLPDLNPNQRRDGLWHHTCFEVFLKKERADNYTEYNLATSGEWAAYFFGDYRSERVEADVPKPNLIIKLNPFRLFLGAYLSIDAQPLSLAISAVIEEIDGTKSYWALAHPPGKPDFHHRDCFALQLAPPEAP